MAKIYFNAYPSNIFVQKMLSVDNLYYKFSNALKTTFIIEGNTTNPIFFLQ